MDLPERITIGDPFYLDSYSYESELSYIREFLHQRNWLGLVEITEYDIIDPSCKYNKVNSHIVFAINKEQLNSYLKGSINTSQNYTLKEIKIRNSEYVVATNTTKDIFITNGSGTVGVIAEIKTKETLEGISIHLSAGNNMSFDYFKRKLMNIFKEI